MLQICDDNETYYYQQEPRTYFSSADHSPCVYLTWIFPCAIEGRNIFSNPNEERYTDKRKVKRHRISFCKNGKRYLSFPKPSKDYGYQYNSRVRKEMVCEEIYIDKNA